MASVTVSVDAGVLRRAQARAAAERTSGHAVVRDYLRAYAGTDQSGSARRPIAGPRVVEAPGDGHRAFALLGDVGGLSELHSEPESDRCSGGSTVWRRRV
jgi:hypothetical protein